MTGNGRTNLVIFNKDMTVSKQYFYKVYNNKLQYLTTWSSDVISDPEFRTVMNGGPGELTVKLARRYDDFGEGNDVALQNRVELWCADNDNLSNNAQDNTLWDTGKWDRDVWDTTLKSFVKIYSGYISGYAPTIDDEEEYITITVLGYIAETSFRILKDLSGNTTVTYTTQDPGAILKDVIDKYRADGGVNINYIGSSIQMTGTKVTYTFNNNTLKECFDKIIQLCPDGWYWFMDANGYIYLNSTQSGGIDHFVTIGRDLVKYQINKRIENLINKVYVQGGGNPALFNVYSRGSSVSTYGKFENRIQDSKVTDNTSADAMAKRTLDRNQSPEVRTLLTVVDNNGIDPTYGQNIESFLVGDTIQVKNLKYGTKGTTLWNVALWDVDVWDATLSYAGADVLTIVSIDYNPDYIDIEAASRLPEITKRMEDINTALITTTQTTLPSSPTPRTV